MHQCLPAGLCVQVVLAGCEGEVHLYSIFVDDTAQAGKQAVATARQALSMPEALPDQASHTHVALYMCNDIVYICTV